MGTLQNIIAGTTIALGAAGTLASDRPNPMEGLSFPHKITLAPESIKKLCKENRDTVDKIVGLDCTKKEEVLEISPASGSGLTTTQKSLLASGVLISVGLGTAYVLRRRKEGKLTLMKDKEPVIHEDEENIGDIPESPASHSPEAKKPEQTTPQTGIFGKVFKSQAEKARDAEQDKQNALREAQEKINAENARKRNSGKSGGTQNSDAVTAEIVQDFEAIRKGRMEGVDLMYHKYLDTVRLKNSSEDSSKTAKDFLKNYSIKAGIILSDSRHSDEDKNEVRKMGREIDPENSLYQKMEIEPESVEGSQGNISSHTDVSIEEMSQVHPTPSQLDAETEELLDIVIQINAITKEYLKCIAEYLNLHGVNTGDNSIEQISIAINSKEFDPSSDEILHEIQAALKDCQAIYPLSSHDEGGIPALTQKFNTVKASYEEFLAYVRSQKKNDTGNKANTKGGDLIDTEVDAVWDDLRENTEIMSWGADEITDTHEVASTSENSSEASTGPRVASTPEDMEKMEKLQNLLKAEKEKRTIH